VPEDTRRKVKAYAAKKGLSMAEAVEELVDKALAEPPVDREVWEYTSRKVKVYAAQQDLTMTQAIEELVNLALKQDMVGDRQPGLVHQFPKPRVGRGRAAVDTNTPRNPRRE
jgi:hypothetical protein